MTGRLRVAAAAGKRWRLCVLLVLGSMLALPLAANDLTASSRYGMVVAEQPLAARVGADILEKRGNAVDAAVATAFAMAVVYPQAGNLGGGGFAVVRMKSGAVTTLDFRETAPWKAHRDMYLDDLGEVVPDLSTEGYLAVGVPGSVAGLIALWKRHGSLPLATLVGPAVELAEKGFEVDAWLEEELEESKEELSKHPSSVAIFFRGDEPLGVGARLVQRDLARTLSTIVSDEGESFYRGAIAQRLAEQMRTHGGLVSEKDLADYRPKWREPVSGTYRGYTVYSMGPPSSGGVALIQILGMLEPYDLRGAGFGSAATVHAMAEVTRRVYADRARYLGDSDFVPVPIEALLDPDYLKERGASIEASKATPSSTVRHGEVVLEESDDTTHFSVVDGEGNAVALTTTLNSTFGAYIVVEGAGFLLNNEMDDFSVKPGVPNLYGLVGGEANAIEPGKRMLSSMTPTIVERGGEVFLVAGSPGGSRIITAVAQVVIDVIDHGMPVFEAVSAPRTHHQWLPDELRAERFGLSPDTIRLLEAMGHEVSVQEPMASVQAILVDERGVRHGASDPRRGGASAAATKPPIR